MPEQTNSKVPQIRFRGFDGQWEGKTFDQNILSIQTGTNLLGSMTGKGSPLLKMGNLQRGSFSFERLECLDGDAKVEAENIAHFGDFLFNTRNTLDLVGKGATWMGESGKFAFNSNLARFKFQGINTIFFNYLYNTSSLVVQVKARAMGTTSVAAIYPKNLNSLEYFLPAPAEQTQIGGYFRELDSLIGLHQRKHDKLVTLKKAMLQKMFPQPGATTPEIRFKGFEGDWVTKELGELSSLITKGTTPLGKSGKGLVNFVKIENINKLTGEIKVTSKISEIEHLSYLKRSQLKAGDILFSIAGTLGRVAVVPETLLPANTNQALAIIRLAGGDVGYITTYLKGRAVDDFVKKNPTVGAQPNLSLEQVENLEVLLPTEREQQKISTYFRTLDALIAKHAIQLQKLQQIKSACLEKMFV